MKICWDNIENLKYHKSVNKWYKSYICKSGRMGSSYFIYKDKCKECGEPFLTIEINKGDFCSKECMNKSYKYHKNNLPQYDTYAEKLSWCEKVRRNQKDPNILEVKCTWCGKWFVPSVKTVNNRLNYLNDNRNSESRFYCSDGCKSSCPIYNKTPETLMKEDALRAGRLGWLELNREVQPELRQMVFERDGWKCTKCGSEKSLHCHHLEGIRWNPLESADIDSCITVCKDCHKEIHQKEGCGYNELQCKEVL